MMAFAAFALLPSIGAVATVAGASFLHAEHASLKGRVASPVFMIMSGVTAPSEMCLVALAENGIAARSDISLQPCAAAVAAGDGRELFSFEGGQLVSIPSRTCLKPSTNESLILDRCVVDPAATFELQGSGQIKIGNGSSCLSQRGDAVGLYNVALRAAAVASSSADDLTHGAGMAVDARATYWASRLGSSSPEELSVDFGYPAVVQAVEIAWEYPAKSFSILVSSDGTRWTQVYSTDINVLNTTRIRLGRTLATKAKVVMYEPHPVYGQSYGRSLYGIRSLSFTAERLQTIAEDCTQAGKHMDARDKYLLVETVAYGETYPAEVLHSELPALDAAMASLAAVTSSLSGARPKLAGCHRDTGFAHGLFAAPSWPQGHDLRNVSSPMREAHQRPVLSAIRSRLASGARTTGDATATVETHGGIELESAMLLLKEARASILEVREALM